MAKESPASAQRGFELPCGSRIVRIEGHALFPGRPKPDAAGGRLCPPQDKEIRLLTTASNPFSIHLE